MGLLESCGPRPSSLFKGPHLLVARSCPTGSESWGPVLPSPLESSRLSAAPVSPSSRCMSIVSEEIHISDSRNSTPDERARHRGSTPTPGPCRPGSARWGLRLWQVGGAVPVPLHPQTPKQYFYEESVLLKYFLLDASCVLRSWSCQLELMIVETNTSECCWEAALGRGGDAASPGDRPVGCATSGPGLVGAADPPLRQQGTITCWNETKAGFAIQRDSEQLPPQFRQERGKRAFPVPVVQQASPDSGSSCSGNPAMGLGWGWQGWGIQPRVASG